MEEKEITLTILKEDILLNNYLESDSCPITKALHRAGYTEFFDTGSIDGVIDGKRVCIWSTQNESYDALLTKLFGMYNHQFGLRMGGFATPIPAQDFIHTIIIGEKDYV